MLCSTSSFWRRRMYGFSVLFSFSIYSAVVKSPNSRLNALKLGKWFYSMKLRRLHSSSGLFCTGVPVKIMMRGQISLLREFKIFAF